MINSKNLRQGSSRSALAKYLLAFGAVASVFALSNSAEALQPGEVARLQGFGPISPQTNFPIWYQDAQGKTLELCTANNDLLGACLFAPPDPTDPTNGAYQQQIGFADEAFWYAAQGDLTIAPSTECPTCSRGLVLYSVEAAYGLGPASKGDEITFTRTRLWIDVPKAGHYRLTTPYEQRDFTIPVGGEGVKAIRITEDILSAAPDFSGPLKGPVGQFLTWDPAFQPAAPAGYSADATIPHEVIGATFVDPATNAPFNAVKFEYLDDPANLGAAGLDGNGNSFILLTQLTVQALDFNGVTPTPLNVPRATFTDGRAEVVADSSTDANVTVAFDTDAALPLVTDGTGSFYVSKARASMPSVATVVSQDPTNGPTTINTLVTDAVTVSAAQYDPTTQTLLVRAASSSSALTPTLTATNFGTIDPTTGSLTVTGVPVAPAWVEVKSSLGGVHRETTHILSESGTGVVAPPPVVPPANGNLPPVAQNDALPVVIGSVTVINVAGNDSDPDGTLNLASIQVVGQPTFGTIGLIGAAGVQYVPGPNFAAQISDTFTYTIQDNLGATSNVASVTVTPVAANLSVNPPLFTRSKNEWRIRGTSSAVGGTVQAFLVHNGVETLIGPGTVLADQTFDIRLSTPGTTPVAGDTVSVRIGTASQTGLLPQIK